MLDDHADDARKGRLVNGRSASKSYILACGFPEIALRRIAFRVQQGGHDIPQKDATRRFRRSWDNFRAIYQPIADAWMIYDNSGDKATLIEQGP